MASLLFFQRNNTYCSDTIFAACQQQRHPVKLLRKQYNLTQEELSLKSGVGLRFVRDLEQGKETLRLDKVNQLLDFFNYEMVATSKIDNQ